MAGLRWGTESAVKKLNYEIKELMVSLSGACFWYWDGYFSFLKSCGVPMILIRRYPKGAYTKYQVMRNILEDLDNANKTEIIHNIVSGFYKLRRPVDTDNLDVEKGKRLLKEFRETIGSDPIDRAIEEQERKKRIEKARSVSEKTQAQIGKLEELKTQFIDLFSDTDKFPQKRGFDLEKIFFELLDLEEFECTKPYRHPGEQIDGHFNFGKFDYLVEVKWTKRKTKQNDLSIFDGKIKGKAQSTRGLFLSVNGFEDNAIRKYSGDSPRIIFMDGQELTNILEGRRTFYDCIKFKVDALVRFGDIYKKE